MAYLMNTYARQNVAFVKGDGVWLWDENQTRYLDAVSGVAVCNLGHADADVARAICAQAGELMHTSNLYQIPLQAQLAEKLCALSGQQVAFFGNSGAEANEAAIKIARKYGNDNGIQNPAIITMEGSFHGRTMATLTATGNPKVKQGFAPYVAGFIQAPYDDIGAIEDIGKNHPEVVAVLVECVQGEGGVRLPSADFLPQLRQLCTANNWLLMIDEVQTGMGRTGSLFAYSQYGICPDVVTLAKGLGNGYPIGACLASGAAADVFGLGSHGSTFGGSPLASRVALTVVDKIVGENLAGNAERIGAQMRQQLGDLLKNNAHVRAIRQSGLLIGIELDRPCAALVQQALAEQLLINVTAGNVVRLLPALIINSEQAGQICQKVAALINADNY